LMLIQQGTGIVQIGNQSYPIIAPAIYCINETESLRLLAGSEMKAKSIYFNPAVVNEKFNTGQKLRQLKCLSVTDSQDVWCLDPFFERFETYYGVIPIDPSIAKYAEQILEEIGEVLNKQSDHNWPCRSRSYLLELLFLIRRVYKKAEMGPSAIPFTAMGEIEPVIKYLHLHYREKIKIEDLTKVFHTNKTTLNQQFRAYTGSSIISYLNLIRMQMASSMLRNTLLPKDEIMVHVGIQDDAHFIRNFRKYAGYSPAEYRNQFCWMQK
jgi:AraC-like DNA-binding protein